jgi:type III restriction enzyme
MGLNNNFPKSPYAILNPNIRWFPGDESLGEKGREKLLAPLVTKIRKEIFEWRKQRDKLALITLIT